MTLPILRLDFNSRMRRKSTKPVPLLCVPHSVLVIGNKAVTKEFEKSQNVTSFVNVVKKKNAEESSSGMFSNR